MPSSDVDTEWDGRRDKLNHYRRPHVPTNAELLQDLHQGIDPKESGNTFNGLDPLPAGLRKPKYAPQRVGGFVE